MKRHAMNPLVASVIGTLWIAIVIIGHTAIGLMIDTDGAWWFGGVWEKP